MNDFVFEFERTPWEMAFDKLHRGDAISAARFLTLLEGEEETAVEDALMELEQKGVTVPTSGNLPELYKGCKATLGMTQDRSWDKRILEMLSGLEKIVSAICGMRNTNSDAHGVGSARIEIKEREARLIVNASITMCEYILDVYDSQK